jgi:hypothetical protein
MVLSSRGSANWNLRKRVTGTETVIADTGVPVAALDRVMVRYTGSSFTVYVNDILAGTYTDSAITSGTKVGLQGAFSSDASSKWGKGDGTVSFYYSAQTT